MKPQFFIIAGPNGAGKSTYGHFHVPAGTRMFNGDLVFAGLVKQHPNIPPEELAGGIAVVLERERDKAIAEKSNFAFESNFSNDLATDITKLFKNAGYETILIYFGLDTLESAAIRVDTRMRLGGHDVPLQTIRFNMQEGIKRVVNNFHIFDRIFFADTILTGIAPIIAYYIKETKKFELLDTKVEWFNAGFREPLRKLALKGS